MTMSSLHQAELAEDAYFEALLAGDIERLEDVLVKDFLIVDVMSGSVVDRTALSAALRDGVLEFERVDLVERATRAYGDTAIIVGRTEMSGAFDGAEFIAASRYTHVLVRDRGGRWCLASAQGTRIADASARSGAGSGRRRRTSTRRGMRTRRRVRPQASTEHAGRPARRRTRCPDPPRRQGSGAARRAAASAFERDRNDVGRAPREGIRQRAADRAGDDPG
jgi:ketosteroid isomerase-like protein